MLANPNQGSAVSPTNLGGTNRSANPAGQAPLPGQPPNPVPNQIPSQPQYSYAPPKPLNWKVIAVISVLGLTAILFGLQQAGLLRFGIKAPEANLSQNAKVPIDSLAVTAKAPDAPLAVNKEAAAKMPADVYAWLCHLQKVEEEKQTITGEELEQLQSMIPAMQSLGGLTSAADVDKMTDPNTDLSKTPGEDNIDSMVQNMQKKWQGLQTDLDSMPPPAECQRIHDAYSSGLAESVQTMQDIVNIVNGINTTSPTLKSDISSSQQQLHSIGKEHVTGVDNNFRMSDDLVQQICDKYSVSKWFSIDSKGGGDSLLSKFGGL